MEEVASDKKDSQKAEAKKRKTGDRNRKLLKRKVHVEISMVASEGTATRM